MQFDRILLSHGSGGRLSQQLIHDVFLKELGNEILDELNDSAVFNVAEGKLAYTTDAYVVSPIFFPGGDIGRLSACGTVNDLSMSGAKPFYLSASFIIEEGLSINDLKTILMSMKQAADEAGVKIVCGDTKVVGRGMADKVFITTSGIGLIPDGIDISPRRIRPGDSVILSGTIGDHGIAILSQREGLGFSSDFISDVAPLNHLVASMLDEVGNDIHAMRDPTRGGLATTLNEFAQVANLGMRIYEDKIPVQDNIRGACELLGFDPLYIANEGKLVTIVENVAGDRVLACMKRHPLGINAEIIGEVVEKPEGMVSLVTRIGGTRVIDMMVGDQLPRIC
ncbi:hydrogenase expression/formation protein HypE [Candidatus Desantisbacteria bacterium CG2_30_40_21]|uniref:Hydrogenase expression/formation protein HypE n=2 Tax=unclassified Candidatus Desantisiibacteriota TaxID=3106372 RepID=A0A2M7JBX0_9BACT|nr:MAG: hydrogenase expression/formation protein HypE [Candidatus Desantisbacteria bacterium CG2_30_40_21]PIX16874.1 MAG: hydrogenase expression/formation protein HypE [Candidatus Desantisbacteria bacterium CG_4_8_14_3_um_filter_40_12]